MDYGTQPKPETPTCGEVFSEGCRESTSWGDIMPIPMALAGFVMFWVFLGINIQHLDHTYSCTLNPALSNVTIIDRGYVLAQNNTCQSCGGLSTCLYLQSENRTGPCCSTPCTTQSNKIVDSLQSIIHVYDWKLSMACPIEKQIYYLEAICNINDQPCQNGQLAYLETSPTLTVCHLDSLTTDCQTHVWEDWFLLPMFMFLISGGIAVCVYCTTKRRIMQSRGIIAT